ncbi:helix-turn-helix transcriptional regulator [Yinghuangia sp. ASG 101]|uniref:helix-turn-helix domain-containing protein n=1 Tax=Yinghuangia sp. ASG 101 TaxID=2896848 RepID=UPI001E28604D|nr:Scr1 family TA system antitoxin-like transcriptional regulator [Yinghuangia sp. ASG 101]UGQ14525.1 helix-turn-helix transcriptional regulator [Yinghuangia sp. ASG 101]
MGLDTSALYLSRQAGQALADLRVALKLSQKAVVALLEEAGLASSQPRVSRIEKGGLWPTDDELEVMLDAYGADEVKRAQIRTWVQSGRAVGTNWWDQYRDLLPVHQHATRDVFVCEDAAERMASYCGGFIPPVLQIEDYARELMAFGYPGEAPKTLRRHIDLRVGRGRVLVRDNPLVADLVVSEAALRAQVGGAEGMRRQLQHVLEMTERDNVTLGVVPFNGRYPWTGFVFHVFDFPGLDVLPIGLQDLPNGTRSTDHPKEVKALRAEFERMKGAALSPEESRKIIATAVKEL